MFTELPKKSDLLKVAQQKRHVRQKKYVFCDGDNITSRDTVGTVNDRVLKTTVSYLDTATEKLSLIRREMNWSRLSQIAVVLRKNKKP